MSTTWDAETLLRTLRAAGRSSSHDEPQGGRMPPHAFGVWAHGTFRPTEAAPLRFTAPLFAAGDTKVDVRFSAMVGGPAGRDIGPNNLGLAVRFGGGGDLIAVNTPLFPVRDPGKFPTFLSEVAGAQDGPQRAIQFLRDHRGSIAATVAYGRSRNRGRPPSFVETTYHGQHAFWLDSVGPAEPALVRFRWTPAAGDRGGRPWNDPVSTLRDELKQRLKSGPASFTLVLEVAGPSQHADDPSEFWPETLERVIAGELLVASASDELPAFDDVGFRPQHPPEGWRPDASDEVMNARNEVYAMARPRGVPQDAAINAPDGETGDQPRL